jgi:hypothetical protein
MQLLGAKSVNRCRNEFTALGARPLIRCAKIASFAVLLLLLWGCGATHTAEIRVADAGTHNPIEFAQVKVERRSLYFGPRARPSFPRLQGAATDSRGVSTVELIEGDNFWIQVTHPGYEAQERLLTPWTLSDPGLAVEFALEPRTTD